MNLRKLGGLSAFVLAAAYVVGAALNFTLLDTASIADPIEKVSFLAGKQALFTIWIFFIYVLFGVCLVFLAKALDEQLRPAASALTGTAAFAQNPAQAATAWLAIDSVHQGLSGMAEIPGGLWTLLVSLAALQAARFPRALSYLGIAIGIAGLLTAIPVLFIPAVAAYALGHCAWWLWLGVLLLRKGSLETAQRRSGFAASPNAS